MAGFSDARENAWLSHILLNTPVTSPTNVYVGLHNGDPGETGANEVSVGSYARQKIGSGGVTTFSAASARSSANVDAITFPQATADWGTIGWVSIWDSLSSGTLIFVGALEASKQILTGSSFRFPAGDLNVTLNSVFSIYLANKILDHELRNTSYTSPTNTWLGFHSDDPGGTGANEFNGNGYGRQRLGAGGDSEFSTPSGGTTDNNSEIAFPAASGGAQGTVNYVVLWDASTSGNSLLEAALATPRTINENDEASFPAGQFDVTLN